MMTMAASETFRVNNENVRFDTNRKNILDYVRNFYETIKRNVVVMLMRQNLGVYFVS